MYTIWITTVFCILAGGVQSQNSEPTFVTKPERYVRVGDSLTMKCAVNEGAAFLVTKVLRLTHKNLKSGVEEKISEQANLVKKYEDLGYTVAFAYDPVFSIEITIPAVTEDVDGKYLCQVKQSADDEILEEDETEVTVLAGVKRVELTVEDQQVVDDGQTLDYKPGELTVGCVAYGSNPQPLIHLTFGGEKITTKMNAILDGEDDSVGRSYKGAVTTTVDFTFEKFGKTLSCEAEVEVPVGVTGFSPVSSPSVVLNGIVDEPRVECSNNTAAVGNRRITLKCRVSKVPKVKRVFFSVGNERLIYPGNQTKDLMECKMRDFNTEFNEIVLQFYQMEEWHFTANIYLEVLGYDGSEFRYPVYLIKGDDDEYTSGTTTTVAASLFVLVCSVLAMMSVLE